MTEAHIYSQGYRRYQGSRSGVAGARMALARHSIRSALGLGMATRHKILPMLVIILAFVPVSALVGLAALLPAGTEDLLPDYPDYYGFISATLYLLAGLIAPAVFCPDRRDGMLGLYLASPLNRNQYLLGKAMALVAMIMAVTLGPTLLMLVAYTFQDLGPGTVGDWLLTLWRVVVSAIVMALPYVSLSAAVSSMTDRRSIASATVLALIPASAPMTEILVSEAGLNPILRLGNIAFLPQALVFRVFDSNEGWPRLENPTWTLWAGWLIWVVAGTAWTWYRYQSIEVTR